MQTRYCQLVVAYPSEYHYASSVLVNTRQKISYAPSYGVLETDALTFVIDRGPRGSRLEPEIVRRSALETNERMSRRAATRSPIFMLYSRRRRETHTLRRYLSSRSRA